MPLLTKSHIPKFQCRLSGRKKHIKAKQTTNREGDSTSPCGRPLFSWHVLFILCLFRECNSNFLRFPVTQCQLRSFSSDFCRDNRHRTATGKCIPSLRQQKNGCRTCNRSNLNRHLRPAWLSVDCATSLSRVDSAKKPEPWTSAVRYTHGRKAFHGFHRVCALGLL